MTVGHHTTPPGSLSPARLITLAFEFITADAEAGQYPVETIPESVAARFNRTSSDFYDAARAVGLTEHGRGRSWITVTRDAARKIYDDAVLGFEEGEPETLTVPSEPVSLELREALAERGIPLTDWQPKIERRQ